MLHDWLVTGFQWVEHWGYLGIFILMAMESSILPVPSEIVMPPAAFWAAQGRLDFAGVILAGTAGSYFGAMLMYFVSRKLGLPVIHRLGRTRYAKFLMLSDEKLRVGEAWVLSHGVVGIFVARLLPVLRHLIGIPAGMFRMPIAQYSLATISGAGIWCFVLA